LALAAVVLTVGLSAVTAAAVTYDAGTNQDPAKISLTGIELGQAVVAILAVVAISGEYSTGMIRATLTAMPRRIAVLAGKAAVLAGVVLAAGTVAVLGSVLAGRLLLPGNGFTAAHGYPPLSLGDGPSFRYA
jgi:ABC-2 type transport system permease protein